jgi:membrane associated rhomboid family serine protease
MFPLYDTIPHRHLPIAMGTIIALNGLVFLYELSLPEADLQRLFLQAGVVPARISNLGLYALLSPDPLLSLLSCMFLHGGWIHFLSNMWALWIFGDNVEDRLGSVRFVVFYLVTGIVATLVHVATQPFSEVPVVGASGAISGVMGTYFVLFPFARVVTLAPFGLVPLLIEVPAFVYLLLWLLIQFQSGLLSLVAPGSVGGVAWWAHVGGFLAGALLCRLCGPARSYRYPKYPRYR